MQLLANISEPLGEHLLDEHVNILAGHIKSKLAALEVGEYPIEPVDKRICLGFCDDIFSAKHGRVRHTSLYILTEHSAIKTDGRIEIIRNAIGYSIGSACPHFCHFIDFLSGILHNIPKF